ncbi:MAG: GNAT family N-acetyltransferase [Oscillospiraceae bacterium]|nr:GNAT family N-acetyltransferase [Oscillospiraceae bacterium]
MVRKYISDDFEQCCDLFIQSFNAPPWDDQWTKERVQIYLQDYIESKRFIGYTLWDNDVLAGAVFAHIRTFYTGDEVHVDELFVSPAHQRKGYGTILMDAIENLGYTQTTLLTGRGKPSFDFYEKRGYKSIDSLAFMRKRPICHTNSVLPLQGEG